MEVQRNTRDRWVRAAVFLQGVVFLVAVWSSVDLLFLWPKLAPRAALSLLRAVSWSTVEAAGSGIAFAGIWKSKRWGWILAVLTDAIMCLFTLSDLTSHAAALLRNPRWLAFSIWDFAAIAVLLHSPVRGYFLSQVDLPRQIESQGTGCAAKARPYPVLGPSSKGTVPKQIYWVERGVRVLFYFVAAMAVACFATTFSLLLRLGEKAEGGRGFLVILLFGFLLGSGPSFLFTLLLTLAARVFGLRRLWAWLLLGALLAPGLILGMGALASKIGWDQAGIVGFIFTGPAWLFQAWWLAIPAGLIAAFVCFQMFAWVFGEPATE